MKTFLFIVSLIIVYTCVIINGYPVDNGSDEYEEGEIPILRPPPSDDGDDAAGPYDEAHVAQEAELNNFVTGEQDVDPEEEYNDSGFHREPGLGRPDDRKNRGKPRNRRMADEDYDEVGEEDLEYDEDYDYETSEDDFVEENYEYGSGQYIEENYPEDDDDGYENDYDEDYLDEYEEDEVERNEPEPQFPSLSQEQDEIDENADDIEDGEYDNEEELGSDSDGALLRLIRQSN